jgi:hypothetical protein
MTDGATKSELIPVKDLLVVIPLVASTLAMTREVGSFFSIGGFHYFSISEHIVSALRALPFAITVSMLLAALAAAAGSKQEELRKKFLAHINKPMFWLVLVLGIAIAWVLAFLLHEFSPYIIIGGCLPLLIYIFLLKNVPVASGTGIAAMSCVMLLVTFGVASDTMKHYLNSNSAQIVEVTTKTGTVTGKMIMSGERGALIYRDDSQAFLFERADEIKSIQWLRIP